jgi:hypothetical protein
VVVTPIRVLRPASGIDEMLHASALRRLTPTAGRFTKILWFSLPVFEYVQHRHATEVKISRRDRAVVHRHLREALIERIADDVAATMQEMPSAGAKIPPRVLVEYVASTFILALNWWVDSNSSLSPREVDDVFLSLVVPTLSTLVGER